MKPISWSRHSKSRKMTFYTIVPWCSFYSQTILFLWADGGVYGWHGLQSCEWRQFWLFQARPQGCIDMLVCLWCKSQLIWLDNLSHTILSLQIVESWETTSGLAWEGNLSFLLWCNWVISVAVKSPSMNFPTCQVSSLRPLLFVLWIYICH